jgi:dTDP-glucose pyrophosphorylase
MTKPELLSRLIIHGDCDLMTAIKKLDEAGMGVLFVINSQGKMLGMMTDGDLRKALLRGHQLNASLVGAMNTQFTYGKSGQSHEASINQLRRIRRCHLPILDEEKRLVDVIFLEEDYFAHNDAPVVLMVGGLGSRLGELTKDTPKPMLQMGNAPILENILSAFIREGFEKFYFAVNYKSHAIEEHFGNGSRWNVNIRYIREEKRLGTAGALSLLPERPDQAFIVMNGDVLTDMNFQKALDFHHESKGKATMAVRKHEVQIPFGVVELKDNCIEKIIEKPVQDFFVNAGIYVLDPSCLDLIPLNTHFDMPELFQRMLNAGEKLSTYLIYEYWRDIGRLQDYEVAQSDSNNRKNGSG